MAEGDDEVELHQKALLNLIAGLPEAERERLLPRLLDELERLHLENGVPVPEWIERIRRRRGGSA